MSHISALRTMKYWLQHTKTAAHEMLIEWMLIGLQKCR